SLVLIVLADQLGKSVGDMYEGAFIPGIVLALLYAVYIFIVSIVAPKATPGLPVEDIGYREKDGSRGVWQLGILVLFSGFVGYYLMKDTDIKNGADFVVLTMSVGVVVSFLCAVFNRTFGARLVLVTGLVMLALIGIWYWLHTHDHPNW